MEKKSIMATLIEVAEKLSALRIEIVELIRKCRSTDAPFDPVAIRKKAAEYISRMDEQLMELTHLRGSTEQDLEEIISLCGSCRFALQQVIIIIPTD